MIGLNSIIIDETSRHRQCGGSPDTGAVFRRHAGLRRLHGTYTYQTARPHAVMSVSNTDNRIGKTQQDITYGPLGKAVSIAEGSARLTLSYGPDRQRWRSRSARKWRTDTLTVETLHDGGYERVTTEDGTVREFHRLGRGLVCVVTDGGSPLVLCALTDNVGSYVQMADSLGQTRFRAGYDVWGRQTVTSNAVDFQRGYGGHEMLPRFALVNMDGRLYDPNLGRFLSPDNYVQAPDDSQSFNRYSYCLNNPLKYTDPTGEVWWVPVLVGAVVGAYAGASIQSGTAAFWHWKGDAWKGAIAGGIIGASVGYLYAGSALAPNTGLFSGAGMKTVGGATLSKAATLTGSIINSGSTNIIFSSITGGGWDEAWKSGVAGLATGAWAVTGGFGMVRGWNATKNVGKMAGKLGYQAIGTVMESMACNWSCNKGIFSKIVLGVGPINLTLGKGEHLIQFWDNFENIFGNGASLVNAAFGAKLRWDWENLTLASAGGLGDILYSPEPYLNDQGKMVHDDTGLTLNSIMGNSNLLGVYSHELHHLWQQRAMLKLFYFNYIFNGITSLFYGGDFINRYNVYEDIANNKLFWP